MTLLLAIDPGDVESAWVVLDVDTRRPLWIAKEANERVLELCLGARPDTLQLPFEGAVEMIASYGMPVGKEVFETCVWIGRFSQALDDAFGRVPELIYRREVKLHHTGDSKAKDGNIAQALIDRFAPGERNRGKGTKDAPGWFYGFKADIWQAYAVGVYVADVMKGWQP